MAASEAILKADNEAIRKRFREANERDEELTEGTITSRADQALLHPYSYRDLIGLFQPEEQLYLTAVVAAIERGQPRGEVFTLPAGFDPANPRGPPRRIARTVATQGPTGAVASSGLGTPQVQPFGSAPKGASGTSGPPGAINPATGSSAAPQRAALRGGLSGGTRRGRHPLAPRPASPRHRPPGRRPPNSKPI